MTENTQRSQMIPDEIESLPQGAQFRRADLHIHSFGEGGSYDVTDSAMTPEAIVDTAISENLQVIAIADHNVIGNVARAIAHAQGKEILVVPGIELSTMQGHLLMYFPTVAKLQAFHGKLNLTADGKACNHSIPQCLTVGEEFGGFGIAAHIDLDSGFEKAHPKYDAFKQDILNSKALLALEIAKPADEDWFTENDASAERKRCGQLRRTALNLEPDVELPKIMSSDAHTLDALGKNAAGNRRLTRIKMDSLTFDSLRIALLDGAARVRLEDLIPQHVPRFVGMKLEGGFLKDQVIHFSSNLTCIIGGRGAGKSTMLESLKACSGNEVTSSVLDSEVWPDAITLVYEDETGRQHVLTRNKLKDVTNADPEGPTRIAIESYGQGETADTIQHCDKDPSILLEFLDGFVDLEELKERDRNIRDALLANQTEIERLQLDLNRIPEIEAAKKTADQQVATLKTQQASEVVEFEQKLATERRFRTDLIDRLNNLLKSINDGLSSEELKNLTAEMDGTTLAVGKEEFESVQKLVLGLATEVEGLASALKDKISAATVAIASQLKVWSTKEQETQQRIEEIRRNLEAQKIKLDIAFIRKVTKDATDYATKLAELKKSVPKQAAAYKQRGELMKSRREVRSRIFTVRQAFATTMNKNLAQTVVDYRVNMRFHEGRLSIEFEEIIKEKMQWRTSRVPKAALIAATITPFQLIDSCDKNDTSLLESIRDDDGGTVFSKADAQAILTELKNWAFYVAVQRCAFEDRPEIKITKTVVAADGSKSYPIRDFSKLSLGQQQSILLTILLFSKSKTPLIIDQPEDNLDSEFIYKTLVRSLRLIKEHRQVIIVTHSANIAVLGDAELIIPLRGASDLSVIRDRGSIDTEETKEIVCTILEGSRKAFVRRQEVYGF